MTNVLRTAISGSYDKFKSEIDACIDEFAELGVEVLEPPKGMPVATARTRIIQPSFRPLPTERGLGVRAIQNRFFAALDKVDFHYVHDLGGYVGSSASMEIGYSLAREPEIPIYIAEPAAATLSEGDLERFRYLEGRLVVAGITEVVRIEQARRAEGQ